MKKITIFLIALVLTGSFISTARAEYAVSFRFGDAGHYGHDRGYTAPVHYDRRYDHRGNSGRGHDSYHRAYWGWPWPVYYQTTVIRTYEPEPRVTQVDDREKFGIGDIIVLSRAGVGDDVIIGKIVKTGSVFDLSVEEVETLKAEGVSRQVINYMLLTARKR